MRGLIATLPSPYITAIPLSEQVIHAHLVLGLRSEPEPGEPAKVHWQPGATQTRFHVVHRNRVGSLGAITSLLSNCGFNITTASVFSTRDGFAVNAFWLDQADDACVGAHPRCVCVAPRNLAPLRTSRCPPSLPLFSRCKGLAIARSSSPDTLVEDIGRAFDALSQSTTPSGTPPPPGATSPQDGGTSSVPSPMLQSMGLPQPRNIPPRINLDGQPTSRQTSRPPSFRGRSAQAGAPESAPPAPVTPVVAAVPRAVQAAPQDVLEALANCALNGTASTSLQAHQAPLAPGSHPLPRTRIRTTPRPAHILPPCPTPHPLFFLARRLHSLSTDCATHRLR